ncbi:MAG: hypothetical protein AB7S26_35835 [Sandaracinaceae bacterium]
MFRCHPPLSSVLAAVVLASACGSRTSTVDDTPDAGPAVRRDAGGATDAGTITPPPPPPPPMRCLARSEPGDGLFGGVPGTGFMMGYAKTGVESRGSHACPRLFIHFGYDETLTGDHVEIEVPYENTGPPPLPGPRMANMNVFYGDQVWTETILVDVLRADGLLDSSLPEDQWRATVRISHHDATTDIDGGFVDLAYCNDFPLCI